MTVEAHQSDLDAVSTVMRHTREIRPQDMPTVTAGERWAPSTSPRTARRAQPTPTPLEVPPLRPDPDMTTTLTSPKGSTAVPRRGAPILLWPVGEMSTRGKKEMGRKAGSGWGGVRDVF